MSTPQPIAASTPANPGPVADQAADPLHMRAVVQDGYGGTEVLRLDRVGRPSIGASEVLLRVRAAGLDMGTWHLMTGTPYLVRLATGLRSPRRPVVGRDVAGTVVAIGSDVTRFAVGEEVFGITTGSIAEYAAAREDRLALVPASLTHEQAAVLGISGTTALRAVMDAGRVQRDQRVLVIGASGGVGTYAVQIAVAAGARVTGVCSAAKADLVRSLGATDVLDYTTGDVLGGPVHYDVIIDIGGRAPVSRLRRALTAHGTLVLVGGEGGDRVSGGMVRQMWAALRSPLVRHRLVMLVPQERAEHLERLAALVDSGSVTPVLASSYPITDVPAAMQLLASGQVRGKVAVTVGGTD